MTIRLTKFVRNFLLHRRSLEASALEQAEAKPAVPAQKPIYSSRVQLGNVSAIIRQRLSTALEMAGIGYFSSDGDGFAYTFHIDFENLSTVVGFVKLLFQDDSRVRARIDPRSGPQPVGKIHAKSISDRKTFDLFCVEHRHETADRVIEFGSLLTIVTWSGEASVTSEEMMACGRANLWASRLRRNTFDQLSSKHADISQGQSHIRRVRFPIDVVYTWVNDQDPTWLESKDSHMSQERREAAIASRALHDERFRNRDELRYSLRSLEFFAPWVRHIYIVTANQTPTWLNIDHPKVRMVSHSDIYQDPSHLPTFNSSGIETQLHHIEGLAEHFIYFNDDVLLGDFCVPEDFFEGNGVMHYFPSDQRSYAPDIDNSREEYLIADANAATLMTTDLGAVGTEIMIHAPLPARKSLLERLERTYAERFAASAAGRFRSKNDIRPIAFMGPHFGYAEGVAAPSSISNRYLSLWKPNIGDQFQGVLTRRNYKTFCINDVGVAPENEARVHDLVVTFLENYFPFKSSFEK